MSAEARRAMLGQPHRLDDPAFLSDLGYVDQPAPGEIAEHLAASIEGHLAAYDDAVAAGAPRSPEVEALRARLEAPAGPGEARGAPEPARANRQPALPPAGPAEERQAQAAKESARAAPAEPRKPSPRATLRPGDPDGWLVFSGRYLDRRRAGFLCEEVEETADPAVGERFRGASLGNYQAAVRLWADAMGNRPVRSYTPQDAREFLALLARVPAGHGKGRPVPVRDAIAAADAEERRKMVEIDASGASPGAIEVAKERARVARLKLATLDRYVGNLRTVFAWAVASGLRPENPFAGVGLTRKAKAAKRAAEPGPARRAWTPAELRKLFADRPDDPALHWAARIAAGTGMRMETILDLRGDDFRDDGAGGWLIAVRRDKTRNGIRDIPLHSALVEAGLLRLAQEAGDGRLFPDLDRDRARGRLSADFTKVFGRHRKRLGLAARGLDFHGFRSTANEAMEATGSDGSPGATLTVRQAILGHSSPALADSAYLRSGPDWRGRRAAIERIPLLAWGV